jgi:hypothetical protein
MCFKIPIRHKPINQKLSNHWYWLDFVTITFDARNLDDFFVRVNGQHHVDSSFGEPGTLSRTFHSGPPPKSTSKSNSRWSKEIRGKLIFSILTM